ncbi:MAG: ParB N-terminal domain-containing protein, partial [bacterium]
QLSKIQLNPDNPRTITGPALEKLIKSLKGFPEMMELREIVVDENMTVLGGNMRILALQKSGAKTCTAKVVTGLTDDQKREFIIKDNSEFGQWDFDLLANGWGELPLVDWGVDLPKDWLKDDDNPENEFNDKKNNLRNGIFIAVGFCDFLILPSAPEYETLNRIFGKHGLFKETLKESILVKIMEAIEDERA